ncbi:MAG: ribose-5-phosphate isomerase RpiA [Chitinophagaceae bacterium]
MLSQEEIKKKLGVFAADFVPDNATIGLGTGSTVYWLIKELAARVREGLSIKIVSTSSSTKKLAAEAGIETIELNEVDSLPATIDGADEIDHNFQLIKGGGGALLQEKMVAHASRKLIIIADESKYVSQLGNFPLPVEVVPSGWKQASKNILATGSKKVLLRQLNSQPYITDNGHYILDCHFGKIEDAAGLNISLHLIPGVVETGLFINMAHTIIIGHADGNIEVNER